MRIIFATIEFLTINKAATGLPNYLYRVSKALINMGHTPIIVTCGEKTEHVYYDGIEVYREKAFSEFAKNEQVNYICNAVVASYKLNRTIKKICSTAKVDLIQYASLFGLALFNYHKVPSVLRLSSYAKVYFSSLESFTKGYVDTVSFIERLAARKVTGIIAPSNVMAIEYSKDVHKKVTVIETPFENDVQIMDCQVLDEKIGDKKYILFFGSLYAEKGIYVIADIIHNVLERYQDYYFVFAGKIEEMNKVNPLTTLYKKAEEYKDRIIYIKPLKHEQLYPIIEHADLVVLPSLMENFSNACLEAMYFGRIVIGTNGTSFEQLIVDGESGLLALPNNAQSLYKKICEGLDFSERKKQLISRRAKARINKLKPEIAVIKLLRYYDYVIKKHQMLH